MRVLLLDNEKITKLNLPDEIHGSFLLNYIAPGSKVNRDIVIDAYENKWILKGSKEFVIYLNNQEVMDNIELVEYSQYKIKITDTNQVLDLYCLPTIEKNGFKANVSINQINIGRNSTNSIIYTNYNIAERECIITNQNNIWYLSYDPNHMGLIYVNDKVITNTTRLYGGDIIFVAGLKIIWMVNFVLVNLPNTFVAINQSELTLYNEEYDTFNNTSFQETSEEDKNIELYKSDEYFYHTPRLSPKIEKKEIKIDSPPPSEIQKDNGFISTSASITMLGSSFVTGYTLITKYNEGTTLQEILPSLVTFVFLILGSILMPKFAESYNKHILKKRENFRFNKYTDYLIKKENEILEEINKQSLIMNENYPSVSALIKNMQLNRNNIWNKEIKDEDFLKVRLGTGDTDALIEIEAEEEHFTLENDELFDKIYQIENQSRILENVPITFSFLENPVSAIVFNCDFEQQYLETVLAQIALNHSAADLKIVFLSSKNSKYDLSFGKFYPHVFSDDKSMRFYSENDDEMKTVSSYLENILNKRMEAKMKKMEEKGEVLEEVDDKKAYRKFDTYYLIVTNDYMLIKNSQFIKKLLAADDNYGFSLLLLSESMRKLPNECKNLINIQSNQKGYIIEENITDQKIFNVEYMNLDMVELGRILINIPLLEVDEESTLPTSLTFLDMFNVSKIEQLNFSNRWRNNDPTMSLATPIGVHTSGEVFNLDLHEKYQGPHGLIAGSTGSGKSEFIITYILSLAINYHPDEVQFVLIDYKGGGLATAFEKKDIKKAIPHIAGTITNLDAGEINRSLVSINSELKRRQRVFNESKSVTNESTMDIYKYQKYYRDGIVKEPISHLFIISDEFAELKAQQPEFMDELVSTARIGRSLGVHLILATQKPSGVVNEQIWSNTRFRICLKVATKSDSTEMLKRPDAASIKETGRFYLQVGYDEYFDIGQSGWSGAKYIPSDRVNKKIDDSIIFINNVGKKVKTINNVSKIDNSKNYGDQLTNIVNELITYGDSINYNPKKLWLDNIPEFIYLGNIINKYKNKQEPYKIVPAIGEYDDPEGQKQDILTIDLNYSNTIIYGAANTGQENILSTIIYSTSVTHAPSEVNFYIIDAGAETLKIFNKMPQVGEICTIEDSEKITNMMVMLDEELDKRKELFSDYNGDFNYYNKKNENKLPQIICIINNYDSFAESYRKLADLLEPFYRECAKYGISFIVTCSALSSIRSKIAEYFQNKLCLRMAKDEDYRNILNAPKKLLPSNFNGRGIVRIDKKCFEFQTAYINEPDMVTDTIKDISIKLKETYKDYKIKRVPTLPDVVTLDLIEGENKDLTKVPIGINVNTKSPYQYNFKNNKINIISANEFTEMIPFIYGLSTLISNLPNIEVKVIDFSKSINPLMTGGKIVSTDFDSVIKTMQDEIVNKKDIMKVYILAGLADIKSLITPESYKIYNNIITNIKTTNNVCLIIFDSYKNINKLQLEPWYSNNVNKNAGIWIGEGIGTQSAIKFANLSMDARKVQFSDMAFADDKEQGIVAIRKVVIQEDQNE